MLAKSIKFSFFPVKMSIRISARGGHTAEANKRALDTYTTLINENYEEPVNRNFPDVTSTVIADLYTLGESGTEDEEEQ